MSSVRPSNGPRSIYQYSNMDPRLSGQRFKTKKTTPNIEVCPESLVSMSEYWYIERGLVGMHLDSWEAT